MPERCIRKDFAECGNSKKSIIETRVQSNGFHSPAIYIKYSWDQELECGLKNEWKYVIEGDVNNIIVDRLLCVVIHADLTHEMNSTVQIAKGKIKLTKSMKLLKHDFVAKDLRTFLYLTKTGIGRLWRAHRFLFFRYPKFHNEESALRNAI